MAARAADADTEVDASPETVSERGAQRVDDSDDDSPNARKAGERCVFYNSSGDHTRMGLVLTETETHYELRPVAVDGEGAALPPTVTVPVGDVVACHPRVDDEEVRDLLELDPADAPNIMHRVRRGYWRDDIYLCVGPITIALNPFTSLDRYSEERMLQYVRVKENLRQLDQLPVHLWAVGHRAYYRMLDGRPQSMLVSGDSGSGKTETCKILQQYLGALSTAFQLEDIKREADAMTANILTTSPIMECFGNARTLQNDNSSRFGKFMKLKFDQQYKYLFACHIEVYLLEKTRVIMHAKGERSYHSFYQLAAGATDDQKIRYQLHDEVTEWMYTGIPRSEQEFEKDAQDHLVVMQAFCNLGIEAEPVYDIIAGLIYLLSVHFEEVEGGGILSPTASERLAFVETLWGVESGLLTKWITVQKFREVEKPCGVTEAREMRDSLAKAVYEGAFLWIVKQLNLTVDARTDETGTNWIGLLDIFGFETFQRNDFEQLLINYANECLQDLYNESVAESMNTYKTQDLEGFENFKLKSQEKVTKTVKTVKHLLKILSDKTRLAERNRTPGELDFAFLEDVVAEYCPDGPKAKRGKEDAIIREPRNPPSDRRAGRPAWKAETVVGVEHYAQLLWYNVLRDPECPRERPGWVAKNADRVSDELKESLRHSNKTGIKSIFPIAGQVKRTTVSGVFSSSLQALMDMIRATDKNWVRCVKPHHSKKPKMFSGDEVMKQLLTVMPMLDTVKMKEQGYPHDFAFREFQKRYECFIGVPPKDRLLPRGELQSFLDEFGQKYLSRAWRKKEDGQAGISRVFLKTHAFDALEDERMKKLHDKAVLIAQASWHMAQYNVSIREALGRWQVITQRQRNVKHAKQVLRGTIRIGAQLGRMIKAQNDARLLSTAMATAIPITPAPSPHMSPLNPRSPFPISTPEEQVEQMQLELTAGGVGARRLGNEVDDLKENLKEVDDLLRVASAEEDEASRNHLSEELQMLKERHEEELAQKDKQLQAQNEELRQLRMQMEAMLRGEPVTATPWDPSPSEASPAEEDASAAPAVVLTTPTLTEVPEGASPEVLVPGSDPPVPAEKPIDPPAPVVRRRPPPPPDPRPGGVLCCAPS